MSARKRRTIMLPNKLGAAGLTAAEPIEVLYVGGVKPYIWIGTATTCITFIDRKATAKKLARFCRDVERGPRR